MKMDLITRPSQLLSTQRNEISANQYASQDETESKHAPSKQSNENANFVDKDMNVTKSRIGRLNKSKKDASNLVTKKARETNKEKQGIPNWVESQRWQ